MKLQQAILAGFVIYMDNPGLSIVGVWETGYISAEPGAPLIRDCVGQATFVKSAAEHRWQNRREQHWREVRARVENQLMDQHVQRTMNDIGELQALKLVAMQHVKGDVAAGIKPVLPKSLEGVLLAYEKLLMTEHKLRGHVVEQAANAARAAPTLREDPQLAGAGPAATLLAEDDGFTDEQIEAMARSAALGNALGAVPVRPAIAGPVAAPAPGPAVVKGDNHDLKPPVMESW